MIVRRLHRLKRTFSVISNDKIINSHRSHYDFLTYDFTNILWTANTWMEWVTTIAIYQTVTIFEGALHFLELARRGAAIERMNGMHTSIYIFRCEKLGGL